MADRKILSNARPPLHPDDVQNRSFSSSFRGVDQHEVRDFLHRLADDLRSNEMEKAGLARELEELRRRLAEPPVITEDMVTAWLGEEAARILKSAQEAAADIRARAISETDQLRSSTTELCSNLHREAQEVLKVRTDEARQAADAIIGAAEADSINILEQAKAAGRELLQEAQSMRAKVLDDLARRRRIGQAQLDELRTGRDELLDGYAVVARTLEEVTVRLRAIETTEPASIEGDSPSSTVSMGELNSASTATAKSNAAELQDRRSGSLRLVQGGNGEPVERETAFEDGEEAVAILRPIADDAARTAASSEANTADHDAPGDIVGTDDFPLVDLTVALADAELAEMTHEADIADAIDSQTLANLTVDLTRETPIGSSDAEPEVDELFARIRATRADAVARAEEVLSDAASSQSGDHSGSVLVEDVIDVEVKVAPQDDISVVNETQPVVEATEDEGEEEIPNPSELERRDLALDALTPALMKKIKRALHDQQNETLDALRTQRSRVDESALPTMEQLIVQFTTAFADSVRTAAQQGAASVSNETELPDSVIDEVVSTAVNLIAEPLDARLRTALKQVIESGDDVEKAAVRTVGSAYREWKSARIEDVAGGALAAAWTRGVYEASSSKKLVWIVDDGTMRCPDCDDNALTGPVAQGDKFPTGHQFPPVHPGCRCLLGASE